MTKPDQPSATSGRDLREDRRPVQTPSGVTLPSANKWRAHGPSARQLEQLSRPVDQTSIELFSQSLTQTQIARVVGVTALSWPSSKT
jgi:hypothetical protein